jgi:hypothetical protein
MKLLSNRLLKTQVLVLADAKTEYCFTSLHGTSIKLVPDTLSQAGQ